MDASSGSTRKLALMMIFLVMICMVFVVSCRELNDHEVTNSGDSEGRFTSSVTTKRASSNLVTSVSDLSTLLPGVAGGNGCAGSFCNTILGCGSGCFSVPPLGLVGACIALYSE
ncbi:hypothetical protein FNV43_RR10515 [Rhamnella rubrinervis]|uniref:Uncharacterized protein n=1 Tax=Rhamnella rubrinervis TaxID=2594499 RepID=A0A8K0MGD8_9ROSA|nr:hypothetical protein FNV43_RR10515 [Rhamnella rubrinervis]